MRHSRGADDRQRQTQSNGRLFSAAAVDTTDGEVYAALAPPAFSIKRISGSKKAAAFVAALQSGVQHGCGIEVYPYNPLSPICDSGGTALTPVANHRLVARRRPRVVSTTSTQRDMNDMFVLFSKDTSDGAAVETLLLPELPASPKERQKAFVGMLVGFVKARDAESAIALYGMAGDLGVKPTENVFNAVLSLCEGERVSQGLRVLSDMREAGFTPAENHYAFLLREAAGRGAYEEAFAQLREMVAAGARPRLRSYAPLLHGLCERPDMTLASEIWAHLTEQGVQPTPEEYVAVFKGWASAAELERRVLDGSVDVFFRQLGESAFELSPPLPVPPPAEEKPQSSATMARKDDYKDKISGSASYLQILLAAFNTCSASHTTDGGRGDMSIISPGKTTAGVTMVSADGLCGHCGGRLGVLGLSAAERARVRSALKRLDSEKNAAASVLGEGRTGTGRDGRDAMGDLEHFARWLEGRRRGGLRFTTVVDGCNVAYYKQNKDGGRFQISQVDFVVRLLESEGERVLVVLPERYLRPVVPNSSRSKGVKNAPSMLSPEDLEIIHGWEQRSALYRCIDGADDDLFWMYFTVSSVDDYDDSNEEGDANLETPDANADINGDVDLDRDSGYRLDNEVQRDRDRVSSGLSGEDRYEGVSRDIGRRLAVVTNDEMRNHRVALLEPVPFKRWRNSQVRSFCFLTAETPGTTPLSSSDVSKSLGDDAEGQLTAAGDAEPESSSESRNILEEGATLPEGRDSSATPRPIVSSLPCFTRDMQAVGNAWHVPIRDHDGGRGSNWFCVNLAAISDRDRRQPGESRFGEVR